MAGIFSVPLLSGSLSAIQGQIKSNRFESANCDGETFLMALKIVSIRTWDTVAPMH